MSQGHGKDYVMTVGSSTLDGQLLVNETLYSTMDSSAVSDVAGHSSWTAADKPTMDQLCRTCGNPPNSNEYLVPIFTGQGVEHKLDVKINKHLPIQVLESDSLALNVCYTCASTIIAWDTLSENCLTVDKKLKAILDNEPAPEEESKKSDAEDDSTMMFDEPPETLDSEDEPLITKARFKKEKKKASPIKKKILTRSKRVSTRSEKTATDSKDNDKERSSDADDEMITIIDLSGTTISEEQDKNYSPIDISYLILNHPTTIHQCDKFPKGFRSKLNLRAHKKVHEEAEEWDNVPLDMSTLDFGQPTSPYQWNKREKSLNSSRSKVQLGTHNKVHEEAGELENVPFELSTSTFKQPTIPYQCGKCDKFYNLKASLNEHYKMHHEKREYPCRICNVNFSKRHAYYKHIWTSHDERKFQCEQCGNQFPEKTLLTKHIKCHSNVRNYICEQCGASFKTSTHLKTHKQGVHGSKDDFVCKICLEKKTSLFGLTSHMRSHFVSGEIFNCQDCDRTFDHKRGLMVHISMMHKDFYMSCDICQVQFKQGDKLCEHLRHYERTRRKTSSTGLRELAIETNQCGGCSEKFVSAAALDDHLNVLSPGSFSCRQCATNHANKCAIIHHVRVNHRDTLPYVCLTCGRGFKCRGTMSSHSLYKHGAKKHKCSYCDKGFALRAHVAPHERLHTGERPYCCTKCGATFRLYTGFQSHMKTHSDHKPFICSVCNKGFIKPETLRIHMRTHTGEKPYTCDVCGRSFSQLGDCRKHRKTHKLVTNSDLL